MRCGLVCALAVLTFVPAAAGAPPLLSAQATPATGAAPLRVVFTAGGDATAYHWDFGDGASADGSSVEHTYASGRWSATLTARSAGGETASQTFVVTAYGLTLTGPLSARYAFRSAFRGAVVPAEGGLLIRLMGPRGELARGLTDGNGSYVLRARVRDPGDYVATSAHGTSQPVTVHVGPKLAAHFLGSRARGGRLSFSARIVPAAAGTLNVTIKRGDSLVLDRSYGSRVAVSLDTRRLTTYTARVELTPADGYVPAVRILRATIVQPRLAVGARGFAVAQIGARLRALGYAAPAGAVFDTRMLDAVYAFEKVHRLPRTGVVDERFWRFLDNPSTPIPRHAQPADHLEVDKSHQVLYVVRGSRVQLIVPISTAGVPGTYTPVGRFSIYRKVPGFDPSPLGTLYDPMYFTAGYAIHGNPSVPPYPASHGCVRVPMWIAPHLYATNSYGETVYVY